MCTSMESLRVVSESEIESSSSSRALGRQVRSGRSLEHMLIAQRGTLVTRASCVVAAGASGRLPRRRLGTAEALAYVLF